MIEYNNLNDFMRTLEEQYKKYNIDPNTTEVVSCGCSNTRKGWCFNLTVKHDNIETILLMPMYKEDKV